jgi:serine/threonine protein kinase
MGHSHFLSDLGLYYPRSPNLRNLKCQISTESQHFFFTSISIRHTHIECYIDLPPQKETVSVMVKDHTIPDVRFPNKKHSVSEKVSRSTVEGSIGIGSTLLHTYEVEQFISSGGLGDVYLARHVVLGTLHAVKVIKSELMGDQKILDLCEREASVLRKIKHEAVVGYEGFLQDENGCSYLIMEYVDGPSLQQVLEDGALSVDQVYQLRDRLISGLRIAHAMNIVHRDISPDNVILPDNQVNKAILIDFGIAKLTAPGIQSIIGDTFAGKYRFASPEQHGFFGGEIGILSDIYSLGLLIAAAAQGRSLDTIEAINSNKVPDLSSVPSELHPQLEAMLQPNPNNRPQSLQIIQQQWPIEQQSLIKPKEPWWAKYKSLFITLAIAIIAIAFVTTILEIIISDREPPTIDNNQEIKSIISEKEQEHRNGLISQERLISAYAHYLDELYKRSRDTDSGELNETISYLQTRFISALNSIDKKTIAGFDPDTIYDYALIMERSESYDKAFWLWEVAAYKGHGPAALEIAKRYDPGLAESYTSPITPSAIHAKRWYEKAIELGVSEARGYLRVLEK